MSAGAPGDVAALARRVQRAVSRPVAERFAALVEAGQDADAADLLVREEGRWLARADAEAVVAHFAPALRGRPLAVREVARDEVVAYPRGEHLALLEDGGEPVRYLVRRRARVFVSPAVVETHGSGAGTVFVTDDRLRDVPLADVDQIWSLGPKD